MSFSSASSSSSSASSTVEEGLFSKAEFSTHRGPQIEAAGRLDWQEQEKAEGAEYSMFNVNFDTYLSDITVKISGDDHVIKCEFE